MSTNIFCTSTSSSPSRVCRRPVVADVQHTVTLLTLAFVRDRYGPSACPAPNAQRPARRAPPKLPSLYARKRAKERATAPSQVSSTRQNDTTTKPTTIFFALQRPTSLCPSSPHQPTIHRPSTIGLARYVLLSSNCPRAPRPGQRWDSLLVADIPSLQVSLHSSRH